MQYRFGRTEQNDSKHEWQTYQRDRVFKSYQTETLGIKNHVEFINYRNNQCEGRVSEIEEKIVNCEKLIKEALKT